MTHKDPSTWKTTASQYGYYKLDKKEVLGYSSIDFAMNLVFQCIALYISYFYTDIFGLKPGHVAIIFAVSRIWDAINDPMMGTICERLQPKKGKYWIYIRWGAIPFGLAAIMTYTTPNFSYGMKVVWAVVGYNLLNMLYTFIMLPELSNFFSEGMGMTLAQGYMLTTVIMAIIMVAILLWGSSQIVERIPAPPIDPNNKASVKDVFYLLFRVGPVFVTFVLFLGVYTMSQVQSTMGAYYINYYANRSDMLSWFSMIMMLFSVIGVPCVPYLTKRLHKKGTVMFGLAVAGIGCLLLYLMPTTAITGMMISRAITGYGYGVLMGICWSVITDPVEYADWKTGKRYTAIVMTLVGLGIKFSMIVGGSLPTAVLEATGYVANQAQNEATLTAIRVMTTLLPLGAVVVAMLVYGLFYHLNEEKIRQIQEDIAKRNAQMAAK